MRGRRGHTQRGSGRARPSVPAAHPARSSPNSENRAAAEPRPGSSGNSSTRLSGAQGDCSTTVHSAAAVAFSATRIAGTSRRRGSPSSPVNTRLEKQWDRSPRAPVISSSDGLHVKRESLHVINHVRTRLAFKLECYPASLNFTQQIRRILSAWFWSDLRDDATPPDSTQAQRGGD